MKSNTLRYCVNFRVFVGGVVTITRVSCLRRVLRGRQNNHIARGNRSSGFDIIESQAGIDPLFRDEFITPECY